jgi:hypothetical protein
VNHAIHVSWRSVSQAATSSLFDGYIAYSRRIETPDASRMSLITTPPMPWA